MRGKLVGAVAVAAAMGAGFGGVAVAGGGSTNDAAPQVSTAKAALPKANAKFARLAAFILADGTVQYAKGVRTVTNPAPGTFCIKPQARAKIRLRRAVPSVTVDWSNSSGNALMAHWRSSGFGCPDGHLEVQTVNGSDGTFDVDGGVAFTVLVP